MANYDFSDLGGQQEHDFSDLGGTVDNQPSLLEQINQSAPVQYVHGMQYGTMHPMMLLGNLLNKNLSKIPNVNIGQMPMPQYGQGQAYEAGKPLGELAGIAGTAELGGLAELPSALSNVGTMSGYGALENPQDRVTGALKGAAYGMGGEALGGIFGAGSDAVKNARMRLNPKYDVNDLFNVLSKNKIDNIKASGSKLYDNALLNNNVGNNPLYDDSLENQPIHSSFLNAIDKGNINASTEDKFNQFQKDPTINNAHDLQSEMGDSIRKLQVKEAWNGSLDPKAQDRLYTYNKLYPSLKDEIAKSLQRIDPSAAQAYNDAALNWATNVVPYRKTSAILRKLGSDADPTLVDKTFNKIQRTNKSEATNTPIPPEINDKINLLHKHVLNQQIAQGIGGAAVGGALSQLGFGSSLGTDLITALVAGGSTPTAFKVLGNRFGGVSSPQFLKTLKETLQKTYTPAYQAGAIGLLNQGQ